MNLPLQKKRCMFSGGIPICLQRDAENPFPSLLLRLPFPSQEGPAEEEPASPDVLCHQRKNREIQRGAFSLCQLGVGSAGKVLSAQH